MSGARSDDRPIWAKWQLNQDGSISVEATYSEASGFVCRKIRFDTLDDAAQRFSAGFRDVVSRCMQEDSRSGRWRP
jgi:hypothetical protein